MEFVLLPSVVGLQPCLWSETDSVRFHLHLRQAKSNHDTGTGSSRQVRGGNVVCVRKQLFAALDRNNGRIGRKFHVWNLLVQPDAARGIFAQSRERQRHL